jgi:hypothetical protein
MFGKLGRVPGVTTAYRKHASGLWATVPIEKRIDSIMMMYDRVNETMNFKYDALIQVLKRRWVAQVHAMDAVFKWLGKSEDYRRKLEASETQRATLKKELARARAELAELRAKFKPTSPA